MPFLSIIIPVYNKGKYLNKCLRSIAEQNFTDWEVVLVDDGSSDNSPDICDKWAKKDSRFLVIHKTNGGASSARNAGLELASGKYIQFTDADDWWEADSFNFLYQEIHFLAQPDILVFGITKVFEDKTILQSVPARRGTFNKIDFFKNLIPEQSQTGIFGCVANKIISRKLLKTYNIRFNTSYKLMEDYDFFLSVYSHSERIAQSAHSGYRYLQNTDNSSSCTEFKVNRIDVITILSKSYQLVSRTCGKQPMAKSLICQQISGQLIAAFLEMESISYSAVRQLAYDLRRECNTIENAELITTGWLSSIIVFFFKRGWFLTLAIFLKLRNTYKTFRL